MSLKDELDGKVKELTSKFTNDLNLMLQKHIPEGKKLSIDKMHLKLSGEDEPMFDSDEGMINCSNPVIINGRLVCK